MCFSNLGPEDIEKAKEFAEKEKLGQIYSEAKEKKSRRKSRLPHSPRAEAAGRMESEVRGGVTRVTLELLVGVTGESLKLRLELKL